MRGGRGEGNFALCLGLSFLTLPQAADLSRCPSYFVILPRVTRVARGGQPKPGMEGGLARKWTGGNLELGALHLELQEDFSWSDSQQVGKRTSRAVLFRSSVVEKDGEPSTACKVGSLGSWGKGTQL